MRYLISIVLILILLFCLSFSKKSQLISDPPFFLAYGKLILVHLEEQTLSLLYSFHPQAPSVALSPDALFWARHGEKSLAAFSPQTGKIEAEVTLPFRPYNHIISPNGKAYITHHTLTSEGFTISVVDTYSKEFSGEIKHISGLRTDLSYDDRFVYLATMGVKRPDNLYLYKIDTRDDRLKEIYRAPKTTYYWKISVNSDSLYICYLSMPKHTSEPKIEIIALSKNKICRTVTASHLPGIREITGKLIFKENKAFIPCRTTEGNYGLAVLDPQLGRVEKVITLTSSIYKVIGLKDDILVYLDDPVEAGEKGISLYFYNLKEEKEVKVINLLEYLEEEGV